MTDGQFYTFVGLAVVGIVILYLVVSLLWDISVNLRDVRGDLRGLDLRIASSNAETRLFEISTASKQAVGELCAIAQPIREEKRRQEMAKYGITQADLDDYARRSATAQTASSQS